MKIVKAVGILSLGFMMTFVLFPWLNTMRDSFYYPTDNTLYTHINTGDNAEVMIQGDLWAYQTFVPADDYVASYLKLKLWVDGVGDGTLDVGLYRAYASGNPYGTALATGSLQASSLLGTPGSWKTVDLSADVTLGKGSRYDIVCNYDNVSTEYVNWRVNSMASAGYGYSLDGGETWNDPVADPPPTPPPPIPPPVTDNVYGAGANDTGEPIGGGFGYSVIWTEGTSDYIVDTASELLDVLDNYATSGEVVYIADNASINMTGNYDIPIPDGVTIASGRGRTEATLGGLIYCTSMTTHYEQLFRPGNDVTFTGIRLRGPDSTIGSNGADPLITGIWASGVQGLNVFNCEIYNWTYSGVSVYSDGCIDFSDPGIAWVHHNYIHHCQRNGLGYGVSVGGSWVLIEANIFDHNRHSIEGERMGPGSEEVNYEARFNIVENSYSDRTTQSNSMFDCHGGNDDSSMGFSAIPDCDYDAGGIIYIHHNTFMCNTWSYDGDTYYRNAVGIRGVPETECIVEWNWFYHEVPPWSEETVVIQRVDLLQDLGCSTGVYDHMFVQDNWYGVTPP